MDSGDMLKQLLEKFTVEEAVIHEELKLVQEQIEQLEGRLEQCSRKRVSLAVDRDKVLDMQQRYGKGNLSVSAEVSSKLESTSPERVTGRERPGRQYSPPGEPETPRAAKPETSPTQAEATPPAEQTYLPDKQTATIALMQGMNAGQTKRRKEQVESVEEAATPILDQVAEVLTPEDDTIAPPVAQSPEKSSNYLSDSIIEQAEKEEDYPTPVPPPLPTTTSQSAPVEPEPPPAPTPAATPVTGIDAVTDLNSDADDEELGSENQKNINDALRRLFR